MKLLPMVLMFMATSAFGEVYTWTDARGSAHYTNRRDDIPVRHRARAKALNYGAEPEAGSGSPHLVQGARPMTQRAAEGADENPVKQSVSSPPDGPGSKSMSPQRMERRERLNPQNRRGRERENSGS